MPSVRSRPIRVLHLSGAIPQEGAGAAALLTHDALKLLGVDSKILFLKDPDLDRNTRWSYQHLSPWHSAFRVLATLLERLPLKAYRSRRHNLFSSGLIGLRLDRLELFQWADVVHLHWVNHGLINIADLSTWGKPIVWTMRDMWPFTGGCHYALGCEGFVHECGHCPLLGSSNAKDISARGLARKRRHLLELGIRWVAVSHWLRDEAARSALLKSASIRVIPSGVRTADFVRVDNAQARRALSLPDKGKVVLLGANNLRENYKGFVFALAALRAAPGPLTVATFGHAVIEPSEIPHRVVNLGYIRGAEKLSEVYSAADVFLAPSVGESFGKTFVEAQCCGLPVACFANTGPADIVEHLRTGYLAARGDEADLVAGLFFALSEKFDRSYISERARMRFDISHAAEQYREIYEELTQD